MIFGVELMMRSFFIVVVAGYANGGTKVLAGDCQQIPIANRSAVFVFHVKA